jgi:hypothetical protein
MQVLKSFDPSAAMSGYINASAADPGCKLLLYNLSIIGIQLNFENGSTAILHPGEANWFLLDGSTPTIEWARYNILNATAGALSQITCQLYRPDEVIEGTYPAFFGYQFNIGNTVTVSQGAFQVLQNDGSASGTVVAETTVAGSPGSNILMQVQGLVEVLEWVNGSLTQIFKTDPGAASVVKLANVGLLAEVLGNLKVDGTTELVGNTTEDGNMSITGTLGVTGNTSMTTASTSGLATLNSASITGNESVGGTLGVTGNTSLSTLSTSGLATLAQILLGNANALQWKDSGGTARTVMQVDGGNNTQVFGVTGTDKFQFLKSDGTLIGLIDLVLGSLNLSNVPVTTITGGAGGTAKHWMPFQGTSFKMLIIEESGFQTGASNQDYTLPTAFTDGAFFWTGSVVTWSFLNAGVVQNCNVVTAFGTAAFQSTVTGYTFGNAAPVQPFNGIRHASGAGSAHTGWTILIGK